MSDKDFKFVPPSNPAADYGLEEIIGQAVGAASVMEFGPGQPDAVFDDAYARQIVEETCKHIRRIFNKDKPNLPACKRCEHPEHDGIVCFALNYPVEAMNVLGPQICGCRP
jgi:hypothetical protein